MIRKLSLVLCLVLLVTSFVSVNSQAKTKRLSPKYYVCYGNRGCKVSLTKKKMTIKGFDVCPERDGGFVIKGGKYTFKLKNCKFYYDVTRISYKTAKRSLKKKPDMLSSFKVNRNNRITEIRIYNW